MSDEHKKDQESGEQEGKRIVLTVSYMSKPHKFPVSTTDNIAQSISRFKSELSLDGTDNIRFVALGKFLDPTKNYQQENIDRDMAVRAFRSNPVSEKKQSSPGIAQQGHGTTTQTSPISPMGNVYGNQNYSSPNMMNNTMNPMMNNMGGTMPGAMDIMSNMTQSQVSLQLDMLINDPAILDGTVRMMMPNRSEQEIEIFKKQFLENMKKMRENPALISMVSSQMREAAHDPNWLNMMQMGNNRGIAMNPLMGQPMGSNAMGNNPMGGQPMGNNPMGNQPMANQPMGSPQAPNPYQMGQYPNPQLSMNRNAAINQILSPCSHGYYHPALFQFTDTGHMFNSYQSGNTQPGHAQPKPALSDKEIEEKYSAQLEQMYQMGYTNKKKNIKALRACGGNLELAINYILDNIGEE